jgi:hypothetical protein
MTEEDDRLRSESLEIEHLLDEIRELVTRPAWERVERVLGRIIGLYAAGLARALRHARDAGASPQFDRMLRDDDLLSSLLVLHGLHPLSIAERVEHALDVARRELGISKDDLALIAIEAGTVRLRATDRLGGGAMASRVAESAIRRAIETVAPEIAGVELAGVEPVQDPDLVQIRRRGAR